MFSKPPAGDDLRHMGRQAGHQLGSQAFASGLDHLFLQLEGHHAQDKAGEREIFWLFHTLFGLLKRELQYGFKVNFFRIAAALDFGTSTHSK
jgi:hypothetical protein